MSQFHQQGHSAATIIGPDESPSRIERVTVGEGASVVVATEHDPDLPFGVPDDDQVGHPHRLAVARVGPVEGLANDPGSKASKMIGQQSLLSLHRPGTARTGPEPADGLQVPIGASRIGTGHLDLFSPDDHRNGQPQPQAGTQPNRHSDTSPKFPFRTSHPIAGQ